MASINVGRVVIGGLVSGVVGNIIDGVANSTIMASDMADLSRKFGMDPSAAQSYAAMAPWILVDFVIGFVAVFTYAAMRPRFGGGPRTAMIAAFVPWLAATMVVYGFTSMGMMSMAAFAKGSIEALVSLEIATLAGAALYTEA